MNTKRPVGRPRTGRLKFLIKLLPEINELAEKRAAKLGIPKSHYIEELIRKDDWWISPELKPQP